jgi:hypothetical protein
MGAAGVHEEDIDREDIEEFSRLGELLAEGPVRRAHQDRA